MKSHARTLSILTLTLLIAPALPAAVVEEVGGSVDVRLAGQDAWRRVEVGDEVAIGEDLRTGPQGRVTLRQGERRIEVSRRSRLRWEARDQLRVDDGRIEISQPSAEEPLEIQGPHTRARLRDGRLHLKVRDRGDRWKSLAGSLEVARPGGEGPVAIPEGRQVFGGPDGLEAPRAISTERDRVRLGGRGRRERHATEEILREDLRWQDTLEKLLTASRRLVRRSENEQVSPEDQAFRQLEELGAALETAQARIQDLTEARTLGTREASRSAVQLAAQADRALETHRSLSSRLERLRTPGPLGGPGAVGVPEVDAAPSGRPDSRVALARLEEATRFLHRYQQALRRFLRVLGRLAQGDPTNIRPGQGARIKERIVGGYRQAERLVLQARAEVQRVPRQDRSPQVTRRAQALRRQWRMVGNQFRRAQQLVRQIQAP